MHKLTNLSFDNTYARLAEPFRQRVDPSPIPDPYLVSFNADASRLIDLDPSEASTPQFVEAFAGNRLLRKSEPIAQRYAGHQFGVYVPQLGDGRAILLGEVRNERGEKWDLHLKGAGRTAFSRFGDGRAVLRSTIREYLCSEAMHHLGIPTTRALCIVGTDMEVYREHVETGALLLRLAPSHVRFGTFEAFYHRQQFDELRALANYVIEHHFPNLTGRVDRCVQMFAAVVESTAELMARWQGVGFAHGVMNTDNMSIHGITLDYGPFGFMEGFNPGYICNHSDETGRYAFHNQPQVAYWNLGRLAQTLTPLAPKEQLAQVLNAYPETFNDRMQSRMREKLGLERAFDDDARLWMDLLELLHAQKLDYTSFFRGLGTFDRHPDADNSSLRSMFSCPRSFDAWSERYRARLEREETSDPERRARMDRVNPRYILRNYLAQNAITRAETIRNFAEVDRLLELLRQPFTDQPGMEAYAEPSPDWGKELTISCSS
jgi:protein adenylyltransferase